MSAVREASWKSRGRGRGGRGSFSGNRDWSAGEGDYEDSATIHRRVLDEEGMADFVRYQQEMDERRDRYERIVKLSRDVNIECKRIIFHLHRTATAKTPEDREKILMEANGRLDEVRNKLLFKIAEELYCLDHYYYVKSYTWAVEEFVEAWAFFKFLKSGDFFLFNEASELLHFGTANDEKKKKLYVELPHLTYLMGLFDVGGELMRLAHSGVYSGSCSTPMKIVNYMRTLFEHFEFLGNAAQNADWTKKYDTFRESLMKVEYAVYKWVIRKAEFPNVCLLK